MQEIIDFLKSNQPQYLATIGEDGKPKVRPFQFMLEHNGKLWFCTSNKKRVFAEIRRNARIALSACSHDFTWLRLEGKAAFSSDPALKADILNANPLVASLYQTPDNPDFEIFHLADAKATLADFSGKPPRSFEL